MIRIFSLSLHCLSGKNFGNNMEVPYTSLRMQNSKESTAQEHNPETNKNFIDPNKIDWDSLLDFKPSVKYI